MKKYGSVLLIRQNEQRGALLKFLPTERISLHHCPAEPSQSEMLCSCVLLGDAYHAEPKSFPLQATGQREVTVKL